MWPPRRVFDPSNNKLHTLLYLNLPSFDQLDNFLHEINHFSCYAVVQIDCICSKIFKLGRRTGNFLRSVGFARNLQK